LQHREYRLPLHELTYRLPALAEGCTGHSTFTILLQEHLIAADDWSCPELLRIYGTFKPADYYFGLIQNWSRRGGSFGEMSVELLAGMAQQEEQRPIVLRHALKELLRISQRERSEIARTSKRHGITLSRAVGGLAHYIFGVFCDSGRPGAGPWPRDQLTLLEALKTSDDLMSKHLLLKLALRFREDETRRSGLLEHLAQALPDNARGLRRLMQAIRECASRKERNRMLNYLGAVNGPAGAAWGPLTLFTFERSLLLLERNDLDLIRARQEFAPEIDRNAFLYLYALADGDRELLKRFNRLYTAVNRGRIRKDGRRQSSESC
jgi:hypothetical protein